MTQLELAAYLTHGDLQPAHLMLNLSLAMSLAFEVRAGVRACALQVLRQHL